MKKNYTFFVSTHGIVAQLQADSDFHRLAGNEVKIYFPNFSFQILNVQ